MIVYGFDRPEIKQQRLEIELRAPRAETHQKLIRIPWEKKSTRCRVIARECETEKPMKKTQLGEMEKMAREKEGVESKRRKQQQQLCIVASEKARVGNMMHLKRQ